MDPILRALELGQRYLNGRCDAAEVDELQRLLVEHPAAADAFAHASRVESDLAGLFSEEPGRRRETEVLEAIERHTRRRRRLGRVLRLAAAACLLLLAGGALVWWLTPPEDRPAPAGFAVLQGEVTSDGRKVNEPREGDRLLVSGPAAATLRLSDGSTAQLQPASRVVLLGRSPGFAQRIELLEGEGRFSVTPSGEAFRVETPAGAVTALGTEFTVKLTQSDKGDPEMSPRLLLAVVVFSGLVEVLSSEGSHRLGAGESRAFDRERPRTEQVAGTITSIKGNKLTISIGRRPNPVEEEIEVGKLVKVLVDGKPGKLSALSKGIVVRLEKNDKGELLSLSAEGPMAAGQVHAVEKGKITLEIRSRDPNAEKPTYEVPDDVKVSIGRKPAKLEDIKSGTYVVLRLSVDRKRALAIGVGGKRSPDRPLGQVKALDEKGKTITLAGRGPDRKFPLGEEVRVEIDGQPAKLADLKVGTNVVLMLEREGKTVVGISTVQVRLPAIRGIVKEVKDRNLKVTVRSREGQSEETFTIPEKAKVTVDGKPAKLADLPAGATVEIAKGRDDSVAEIRATGPVVVGTVKSAAEGKLTLVDRSSEEKTYPVAKDATILIGGKPAKLADVKVDLLVGVRLSVDRKQILEIRDLSRRGERE